MNIAILTGATGGLGGEYLDLLKKEDLDQIWIIGRRRERLDALAENDKRVISLALDLTLKESFKTLSDLLEKEKANVRFLINNAGFGTLGYFEEISPAKLSECVSLNAVGVVEMCALCLPYMKKGSGIINVSSISSFAPNPRLAVYSATKAFVKNLSLSLREELKVRGINVLSLCPGPMKTEFLSVAGIERGESKMFDTLPKTLPRKAAQGSLRALKKGKATYTPRLLFKVYRVLSAVVPHPLLVKFTRV